MTELEGGEATTVEDTAQAAVEAAVSPQETESAPQRDYEAEAREMGWVPEAEWKGDKRPAKFLSAEEFVERGETVIPILKSQLQREREEFAKRIERMEKAQERSVERLKKQHEQEIEGLKAQRKDYIKAGNVDAVEAIDNRIEELQSDGDEPKADTQEAMEARQRAWEAKPENAWFNDDFKMRQYAIDWSGFNAARNPNLSFEENMKALDAEMRREFPDKFGAKKPAANGHAAVDGGGDLSGVVPRKETLFAKLPPEAKAQAKKDVDAGLYKNSEEWAKVYFG